MKRENDYWVDDRQNMWDIYKYTKKEAKKAATTLVNCFKCVNCKNCYACTGCKQVSNSTFCHNVNDSYDCHNCSYCENCKNCKNCKDCANCHVCDDCVDCKDCTRCRSYQSNPYRIIVPNDDLRYYNYTIYWTNINNVTINWYDFSGTPEEYKNYIGEKYDTDYKPFIDKILKLIEE